MVRKYPPIADYALIGNCRTAALISRSGSIDWYCPGRFDAPAILCRLLDTGRGGYLAICPPDDAESGWKTERRYLPNTNMLETTFHAGDACMRVTDYMPMKGGEEQAWEPKYTGESRIVRRIEGVSGEMDVCIRFKPTWHYARDGASFQEDGESLLACCGDEQIGLSCPGATIHQVDDTTWEARLHVREGECRNVVLLACPGKDATAKALQERSEDDGFDRTKSFWEEWAGKCTYKGPYREDVLRSALVLKLLTYDPTGAVVAAPTTSLPEDIGGERNWDYRYTWLRDSSLILYALLTVGYQEEAVHFIGWLRHVIGKHLKQNPQIMYTIDGDEKIPEKKLTYLDGYRGSKPVRIGNAAARQVQLDIYGEVMSAAYIHFHRPETQNGKRAASKLQGACPDEETWRLLRTLVDDVTHAWKGKDSGIWEVRGGPRDYVYSKLMCWVAVDRGIRIAEEHHLEADIDRWKSVRDEIRSAVEDQGYDKKLGAFVQSFGSDVLDSAVLAVPRTGFLPATDPRVLSTIDQVRKHLQTDGLVYRYRAEDGLAGTEGAFLLCTFWLVEAQALAGRTDEARKLFEKVLDHRNDLGLYSEEIEPHSGEFLGNFPQGFTHLALIRSAVDIAKSDVHGAEHHAQNEGERVHMAHHAAKSHR